MASPAITSVLRHIRRVSGGPGDHQPADRHLLEDFAAGRDEAAFAGLVTRHGPMVLSVCRGVLGDVHAAEDAFQATFLILARKAGAIRQRQCVAGWLCQVARRVAQRSRARSQRYNTNEKGAIAMSSAEPWLDLSLRELRSAVQEEVGRLPEKYRTPVVLFHLEGKSQDEAARLLGVSGGAVKGRLERGRRLLRTRLAKRGLALPAALLATTLAKAGETVPERLAAAAARAATAGLAGVSAEVLELAREVTVPMIGKLKIATAVLIVALGIGGTVAVCGAGVPPAKEAGGTPAPQKSSPPPAAVAETLNYSGVVVDKDTGKPIAGATVVVRRSLLEDPEEAERNRIIEESKHTTDAAGKFAFTIPPEQSGKRYLYIELDVEHPDYMARKGFGYALSMIRKNEKVGGRPFFEKTELLRGSPVTGIVQTPDGKPSAGVKVQAYSVPEHDKNGGFEFGSFIDTRTDTDGRFRLPLVTKGFAVLWLLPKDFVPSTHVLKDNKRGDLGTFMLRSGIRLRGKVLDAKGKPVAGVIVNAESQDRNEAITEPVADQINRSATTNEKGEFAMNPLPPGKYKVAPGDYARDGSLDRKNRGVSMRHALPGVFLGTTVKLTDGEEPEAVEVRAVPHVIVEAQYLDSKGKPGRGYSGHIHGLLDKSLWYSEAKSDKDGKLTAFVPHGLENARLQLMTNEHGALRWRKAKGEPLQNAREIPLGTLTDDVRGIEIIRYNAPILLVKVTVKDGSKPADLDVTAEYGRDRYPNTGRYVRPNGRHTGVLFEHQEDGRFRSEQLLPDEEVTVTAQAAGYTAETVKVKLPEGETKEIEITLEKAAVQGKANQPPAPAAAKPEALHYDCKVTDKDTGKPVAGATVTIYRSLVGDRDEKQYNRVLETTKHTTDAEGKYAFDITAEQAAKRAMYIQVKIEHPDYEMHNGGYALSMIRKNEKLGSRPFFENIPLRHGMPVTGVIQTPDGKPAAGVKVAALSEPNEREVFLHHSYAEATTDANGRFRVPVTTPAEYAALFIMPKDFAPVAQFLKDNKRGDLGTIILRPGVRLHGRVLDAKGKPLAGVIVNGSRTGDEVDPYWANYLGRSGVSGVDGTFTLNPLPPGKYQLAPAENRQEGSSDWTDFQPRPVPGAFVPTKLTLTEGEEPTAIEIRAVPTVVVEARHVNSKGEPTRGFEADVSGDLDKQFWSGQTKPPKDGKIVAEVPHGLEGATLHIITNEHGSLRWRRAKGEPLHNTFRIPLGTLTDDVRGIEIVNYKAPILLVKVTAKDGTKLGDVLVKAMYGPGRSTYPEGLADGLDNSDVGFEKQEDGRYRSSQMLPDEEAMVSVKVPGYTYVPVKVTLAEGATKEIEIALEKAPAKEDDRKKGK